LLFLFLSLTKPINSMLMKKLLLPVFLSLIISAQALAQTYCANDYIDCESIPNQAVEGGDSWTQFESPGYGYYYGTPGQILYWSSDQFLLRYTGSDILLPGNTFTPSQYYTFSGGDKTMYVLCKMEKWQCISGTNWNDLGVFYSIKTITIHPIVNVSITSVSAVCKNAAPIGLSATPTGGSFNGVGVSGSSFNPASSSVVVGSNDVYYSYTDAYQCNYSSTLTINVKALPTVTVGNMSPVCVDHAAVTLSTGTPLGGTYSGAGVSGTTFTPTTVGAGSKIITYTYTDGNSCTNSATNTINVIALPTISFPGTAACIDKPAYQLTAASGSPVGGTGVYSGTGVSSNNFNPSVAGVGPKTLTYTYTDGNGCVNSGTGTVTVNAKPTPTLTVSPAKVCVNASPVALGGGAPTGGSYSGTGVISNSFNPVSTGSGLQSITYNYTDGNGCSNTVTNTINVVGLTTLKLDTSRACLNASAISLPSVMKGTPTGGTYTGSGVTPATGSFNPPDAGAGLKTITYTYIDGNQCVNTTTNTIRVLSLPVVTFDPIPAACKDANPFTLTGGSPTGGNYSAASGVNNGVFTPSGTAGTQTITYTYTDSKTGCVNSANKVLTVLDAGKPAWPEFVDAPKSAMCKGNDQTLTLKNGDTYNIQWLSGTTSLGTDKSYTITGISQDVPLTIKYKDANNCVSDDRNLTIELDKISADFIARTTTVKKGDSVNFTNASINSSKWIWTVGAEHYTTQNIGIYFNNIGKETIKLVSISNINCKDSLTRTNYISVTATGVNDAKSAGSDLVVVYPNPFNDIINVDLTDKNEDAVVSIINMSGTKVIEKEFSKASGVVTISTNGLPAGTYLMVLTMEGKTSTVKLEKR
jgi:hypothetical protein